MNCLKMLTVLLAVCSTGAFAYQKADVPATKTAGKSDKPVPIEFMTVEQLKTKIAANEPILVIDLRAPSSYQQSDKKIKGAIFTKFRKVTSRFRDVPLDKEIVLYCACPDDELSVLGAQELQKAGYKHVRALKGGWQAWIQGGGQVQEKRKTP